MEEATNAVEIPARSNPPAGGEDGSNHQEIPSTEELALTPEEQELFHRMMEVGVFYGRSKSRTNPLMKEFILTTRSGFEVIDVGKTIAGLKDASRVIEEVIKTNGLILLVGTSPAVKWSIKEAATKLGLPYVTERWLGGTLTNFKIISNRITQFRKLKVGREAGEFEKYTKKERLKIERELAKAETLFGGLEKMDRFPALLFIADLTQNTLAAREAKQKGVPIVAFLNTDANPELADYKIPANDRSPQSIQLLMEYLVEVVERAKIASLVKSKIDDGPSI